MNHPKRKSRKKLIAEINRLQIELFAHRMATKATMFAYEAAMRSMAGNTKFENGGIVVNPNTGEGAEISILPNCNTGTVLRADTFAVVLL